MDIQNLLITINIIQATITAAALIYASKQSKGLQKSIESNVYLGIVERGNVLFERSIDYPRTLGAMLFPPPNESLSPSEVSEYYMKQSYLLSVFNLFHLVYLQKKAGTVGEVSWIRWTALIRYWCENNKEFAEFWKTVPVRDSRYDPGFVQFINQIVKND